MEYKICTNCNTKLNGFMTSRYIVKETTTSLITDFKNEMAEAYCSGCALPYLTQYAELVSSEKERLQEVIKTNLKRIPNITAHSPLNWDYTITSIVSAQTITSLHYLCVIRSKYKVNN
jgi:hypothetical protein